MVRKRKTLADRAGKDLRRLTLEEQEAALSKVSDSGSSPSIKTRKINRVTVDFPNHVYNVMKARTQSNGQTMKGYIVALVKKDLEG